MVYVCAYRPWGSGEFVLNDCMIESCPLSLWLYLSARQLGSSAPSPTIKPTSHPPSATTPDEDTCPWPPACLPTLSSSPQKTTKKWKRKIVNWHVVCDTGICFNRKTVLMAVDIIIACELMKSYKTINLSQTLPGSISFQQFIDITTIKAKESVKNWLTIHDHDINPS